MDESIPSNPSGGRTLVVDGADPHCYSLPSAALREASEQDQVYVRPGIYEDKIFVSDRPVRLIGSGRDQVQIFCRRGGPLYLQRVLGGRISGITFRYVGSDQHSAINVLDSTCMIADCRAMEGVLSGVVLYGPECRATFSGNEVCRNRESGIFVFAGAQPRVADNRCFDNHHFGIAVRDDGTRPDLVRNQCAGNMLSGILLFHHGSALLAGNECRGNQHWGIVVTPDAHPNPDHAELANANDLAGNPRGTYVVTDQPLEDIGR
ncbi:MAG: right-handed parallel beta-helix repeat-containing protein [Nitrospira sp.]